MTTRRLLMIANDFPPIGGAGVQRSVYFAKHLPELGWEPTVLTVPEVVFPTKDATLLEELPPEVEVVRAESLELRRVLWLAHCLRRGRSRPPESSPRPAESPASAAAGPAVTPRGRELGRSLRRWLFVPDDRILWAPFAIPTALSLIRKKGIQAVYATTPCYSSGVIGWLVSRLARIPLILDLRDPWSRDPYLPSPTPFHAWLNSRLEALAVRGAERVVVISQQMETIFRRAYPDLPAEKIQVITNGFDRRKLEAAAPIDHGGETVLAYVGSLYAHHAEAFAAFCAAWKRLHQERPDLVSGARLDLVGRLDPEIQSLLDRHPELPVRVLGYQPHGEALRHLRSASALLLLIRDLDPERDLITIPGKVFEYIASSRPVLMIGPEGDAAQIVRETGGTVHPEADIGGIMDALGRLLEGGSARGAAPGEGLGERYERRNLARRLAEEIDATLALRNNDP